MRTKQAAEYLRARGMSISVSQLQKLRCRGDDDPRDKGPRYTRNPVDDVCDYTPKALDEYHAEWLAGHELRTPPSLHTRLRVQAASQAREAARARNKRRARRARGLARAPPNQ